VAITDEVKPTPTNTCHQKKTTHNKHLELSDIKGCKWCNSRIRIFKHQKMQMGILKSINNLWN